MTDRLAVAALSALALLSLWLTPFFAFARQTGGRSAVLLLPDRVIDFTGRTEALAVGGMGLVLTAASTLLLALVLASLLGPRLRRVLWLILGVALIAVTAWGVGQAQRAVFEARLGLVSTELAQAITSPTDRMNVPALEQILSDAPNTTIATTVLLSRQAGLTIRRLAFENAGIGLAAFLLYLTAALAVLFGLRALPRMDALIGRLLRRVAVPITAIALALLVAGVVILILQPTPVGPGVTIADGFTYLVGRLELLWFAYLTLFANSLGTVGGLAESLKFATPLIFTGLAVAFGFQAGLFNIGAPGQMILGAVGAMLVGLYLPGPALVVLPAAVLGAALLGGLWGAIPGWLKARFGANEVINTILMNYIAASLLLFLLSSQLVFAAAALRILLVIGVMVGVLLLILLLPVARRALGRAPRVALAIFGVLLLAGSVAAGLSRPGDAPVSFTLPFKAPGSEPKSRLIQETARLQQLPALVGVDRQVSAGEAVVWLNAAPYLALVALALALWLFSRVLRRSWWLRLALALAVAGGVYALALGVGLGAVQTVIPPTNLNTSFILALLAAVFVQLFLWRTKWGYELRAVGLAPKAAEYGGASIPRNTVLAMAISGALAGLTATHYVLGGALEEYSLRQALPTNDGFDGIAVALLGGNTPFGVVVSAFLFGVLKNGGTVLNITFPNLTRDVVSMVLALVVLFIAARGFLPERVTNPLKRRGPPDEVSEDTVAQHTLIPPAPTARTPEGR